MMKGRFRGIQTERERERESKSETMKERERKKNCYIKEFNCKTVSHGSLFFFSPLFNYFFVCDACIDSRIYGEEQWSSGFNQ